MEINEDILIRYIDGMLTEEEAVEIKDWRAVSPANEKMLEQVYFTTQVACRLRVMQTVNLDEALSRFKSRIHKKKRKLALRRALNSIQQLAAMLFIPFFLLSVYLFIQQSQGNVRMLTVRTNPGVVSAFDLPDGSKVWLNANSELRYPSDFDADTRRVELTGQGYFEVTKDAHKPFIVTVDKNYSVEVLGTSFNISAYKDENMIETTLVEGTVKLNVLSGGKQMTQMLRPNEKAKYRKGTGKIKVVDVNTEYDTAWKNGEIIFRNHPMNKVLKTLERHYHVVFDVKDNDILKSIITARFKDEQLPQVLEYLRLASGIQYAVHKPTAKSGGPGISVIEISK
ncbi:FecR family protein [uncultured Parabacteroides sp.]|uniref:FecR family protein n=1 Tax=uncultured Parabacteroides sp. TaxID=512312 RepID=UPI002625476C|nr:FecR family protein [uncultured Parabacteroides sp.]